MSRSTNIYTYLNSIRNWMKQDYVHVTCDAWNCTICDLKNSRYLMLQQGLCHENIGRLLLFLNSRFLTGQMFWYRRVYSSDGLGDAAKHSVLFRAVDPTVYLGNRRIRSWLSNGRFRSVYAKIQFEPFVPKLTADRRSTPGCLATSPDPLGTTYLFLIFHQNWLLPMWNYTTIQQNRHVAFHTTLQPHVLIGSRKRMIVKWSRVLCDSTPNYWIN